MPDERYELVRFVDGDFELEVNVSPAEETVWLKADDIAKLFLVDRTSIQRHIHNIIQSGELDLSTCAFFAQVQRENGRTVKRNIRIYNLDMIIAVGYRVNSKRGTIFRKWANSVLKQYLLKGYAIDQSRVMVTQDNYLNLVNVVTDMKSSQLKT